LEIKGDEHRKEIELKLREHGYKFKIINWE
jgi:hypothetical protein